MVSLFFFCESMFTFAFDLYVSVKRNIDRSLCWSIYGVVNLLTSDGFCWSIGVAIFHLQLFDMAFTLGSFDYWWVWYCGAKYHWCYLILVTNAFVLVAFRFDRKMQRHKEGFWWKRNAVSHGFFYCIRLPLLAISFDSF